MRISKNLQITGAFLVGMVMLSGCNESMPEVNEMNCRYETLQTIKDDAMRKEFISKCQEDFSKRLLTGPAGGYIGPE